MSFGHIEGMPHQYPYHELHAQQAAPGPLPNYNFAPHPQGNTPNFSSSESHHDSVATTGPEQQVPPYAFHKSWSGITPGSTYRSAGEQHGLPVLASQWYPQPPSFAHTGESPPNVPYEQNQQFYSERPNPG